MQLVSNTRYKFHKVFWVVTAVVILFNAFAFISGMMFQEKQQVFDKLLTPVYIFREIISSLVNVFFYFITLNLYNRLIVQRAGITKYIMVSLPGFLFLLLYHGVIEHLIPLNDKMHLMKVAAMAYAYGIISFSTVACSIIIAYINSLRDEKKQKKVLEAQKMQLEIEKSQANLNFLKAQINPHFLHNTLNYLYAKSLPLSLELSEGILTLSDIMRYALSDGNTVDGKSLLKEEVEHVQNVIRIQQLRFSNKLNVDLEIKGSLDGERIIPFVLITLVENAFKHGDLKDADAPILIHLNIENHVLSFYCRNKKKTGPKEISTGVGLDNIRKRLELAYGNKHSFNATDEHGFYTTELTIQLT